MRYHNITKDDMLNGDGLRVVLWVAGCSHHCKGCQNPITWDPNGGIPFDEAAKQEIFEQLDKDYISGITFSGGPAPCCQRGGFDGSRKRNQENILPKISGFTPDTGGKRSVIMRSFSTPMFLWTDVLFSSSWM